METTRNLASLTARFRSAGLLPTAVAIASLVIITVCGFNSLADVGRSFPGFFVWENLFVPAVGEPSWTGSASGLEYHSWLIAADGRQLETIDDLHSVLAGKEAGDVVTYEAERQGARYTVSVPLMTFDPGAYLTSTGIFLFDAVVLMALALVLLYVKPGDPGANAVFYFSSAQALYLATSIDLFGPYHFRSLYFFFAGLTPVCTVYMLSHFPIGRQRRAWETPLLALGFAGVVAFGIGSNAVFFSDKNLLLLLDRICHFSMAASAAIAFVFFAVHFAKAQSYVVRQRTKVVLFGSVAGFLPTMIFLVVFYTGAASIPFNFLAIPFVFFPLGIGYAVAKHDLFDVDRIIKRTLVYGTLSALVLAVYWASISTFDTLFTNATELASRTAEGVVILLLILVTGSSRQRIQDLVDRLYDRQRYSYRDVVTSAAHAFRTMLDFDRLVRAVLHLLDDTLQPELVRLYTVAANGVPRLHGELSHRAGEAATITVEVAGTEAPEVAPVARALSQRDALNVEQESVAGARTAAACETLAKTGGSLAAAMPLEDKLVGMIIVGRRRAGGHMTGDDLALLRTVADQLAVALENAQSYKTIGTLNEDLETKNVELEHTNRELAEAQDELVAKERLAAIGELAGAVAHTIRNPLAGMRATAQQAVAELEGHATSDLLDDFVHETDRLNERITALLDFSRPFEPEPKSTTLEEIVEGALDSTRANADAKRVTVDFVRPNTPAEVMVDPVLFEQLAVELLANAIDATPGDGKVVVATGTDGTATSSHAWLEVRDSGGGVREDAREDLFRLFFTTKAGGTGFGLATVKKIVDRHGGTIAVSTAPEGGACFRVEVPTRPIATMKYE